MKGCFLPKHVVLAVAFAPRVAAFASSYAPSSSRTAPHATRLFATATPAVDVTQQDKEIWWCARAKTFIDRRNAAGSGTASLEPVFAMCDMDRVDLYGLKGDNNTVQSGLTAFFDSHPGLYHQLLDEPVVVAPYTVQYAFSKSWKDEQGAEITWKSVDPDKSRNKVERLLFDEKDLLIKVSVEQVE